MKNILFSFFMLLGVIASAQSKHGCVFMTPTVMDNSSGVNVIRVTIGIIADPNSTPNTFGLGSTNFRFNYNKNALGLPSVIAEVFPAEFGATSTTGTSATTGTCSVNTSFNGSANASTIIVNSLTPTPLVTLEFPITNATSTADFVFRQGQTALATGGATNPRTTILDDDKVTTVYAIPALYQDAAPSLPITLKTFTAFEKGKVNEVIWETAAEENVRIFVVEKSSNGFDWTKLGETTPNHSMRYAMIDGTPFKTTYYRLRNIDIDDRTDVSQMIVVNRKSKDDGIKFNVQPNPVVDNMKVYFENGIKSSVTSTIMNVSGQIVKSQLTALLSKDAEVNTFDIDMSDLPAGTYFLKVNSDKEEAVETIIKQ